MFSIKKNMLLGARGVWGVARPETPNPKPRRANHGERKEDDEAPTANEPQFQTRTGPRKDKEHTEAKRQPGALPLYPGLGDIRGADLGRFGPPGASGYCIRIPLLSESVAPITISKSRTREEKEGFPDTVNCDEKLSIHRRARTCPAQAQP